MQTLAKSFDFIINTASADIPFDPYLSLLKTAGILVLVGFPSEVKFSPGSLIMGRGLSTLSHLYLHLVLLKATIMLSLYLLQV